MATQEHVSDIVPAVPEPSPRLAARVRAVNRANVRANELHPELISIIRPFLGSKVTKADGSLTAKVQKALPDFPYAIDLHVYRQSSDYSLVWTVKTCESYSETSCLYHEAFVYVGRLKDGVLTELQESPPGLRTDFDAHEIIRARNAYDAARKSADAILDAIHPFGMTDS